MRNPFKRQSRPADKPTLRERIDATREKFGRTLRVHRALNAPARAAEPAPDRAALVNYATFLAWERNRVCAELYPHLGTKAVGFVLGMNAAERFFYGTDANRRDRPDLPPASTRAVAVLDLVGVDWRSDPPGDGIERGVGLDLAEDTGERPALPEGWPAPDADLVMAAGDLLRLDAAIAELLRGTDRDPKAVPGYTDLDDARDETLATLSNGRAYSLDGLQARARALLTPGVQGDAATMDDVAHALACDLLAATGTTITPRPDPILAAIREGERLLQASADVYRLPDIGLDPLPEKVDASEALYAHVNNVLLKTVPTTAAGCAALVKFAQTFHESEGISLCEGNEALVSLIARSPAL